MKNQLLLLAALAATIFSCQSKESETPTTPLSEQKLEFEIYDSLVVDYLGNLVLMDISPNGNKFLLIDQNTDTILVSNSEGTILFKYKKEGEGPDNYSGSRWGNARFLNESDYLLPTFSGFFHFELDGTLLKKYQLDFTPHAVLTIPNNDNFILKDKKIYSNLSGRGVDEFGTSGLDYQKKAFQMEILDLETGKFASAIRFPKSSKYSSTEKSYSDLEFYRSLTSTEDSLFLSFRNEPKIFGYSFSNLNIEPSSKPIPFPNFIQKEPTDKNPKEGFSLNDLFLGTINQMISISDQVFLIDYLQGLTKDEFDDVLSRAGGDTKKIFELAEEINKGGWVLFDGKTISLPILKPELLGSFNKFISKEEIWFSLNFTEFEKDYSVMYKTKLIQK
ncbi:hypothetical protein [Algoriphagus marinus]|uniref:hypothetical protein n=1 Tax=Algoriphagus marinus TaxID=1925762 RepID=UPI00094B9C7B|nr:hypothetical protein [Algoriphagus marinus]